MRVLQLGFGAVGRENVRQLLNKGYRVVAIVDTQGVIDRINLGDFAFDDAALPILGADLSACLAAARPDVILQATTFEIADMLEVARAAATAGSDLITINGIVDTDTLQPQFHDEIDAIARQGGIRLLGVGAVPGFFSDLLPMVLTGSCSHVQSVDFKRRADYSRWGADVMRRYGFGLTPHEFQKATEEGQITLFTSLWQSAYFIARQLRWPVAAEHESKRPIISSRHRQGECVRVAPGTVGGFSHSVTLVSDNERRINLEVVGYLDPSGGGEEPGMSVDIGGTPTMHLEVGGDILSSAGSMTSSSARMVNSIEPLTTLSPGLRSTADLPLVACRRC